MNEVFVLKEGYAYTTESGKLGYIADQTAAFMMTMNLFYFLIT